MLKIEYNNTICSNHRLGDVIQYNSFENSRPGLKIPHDQLLILLSTASLGLCNDLQATDGDDQFHHQCTK